MTPPESEQFAREAQRQEQRSKLNERLEELMKSGIKMEEIADILDAQEFLYRQDVKTKKGGEVTGFDAKRFIDTQIEAESKLRLPKKVIKTTKTILPPGEGEIITGSGKGIEAKKYIPRTRYFMELMEEMDLEYTLIEGENTDEMMRQKEYIPFAIPDKQRLVFICNEEGNATYIVESEDPEGEWEQYAGMTKDELRELREEVGGVGLISWKGEERDWKNKINKFLEIKEILRKGEIISSKKIEKDDASGYKGWMSRADLVKRYGKSYKFYNGLFKKFEEEHSDQVRMLDRKGGARPIKCISPELVEKIDKMQKPKDGWIVRNDLAKMIGVDFTTIDSRVNIYKMTHPEWVEDLEDEHIQLRTYISPELAAIIKEEFTKETIAPENWVSVNSIRNELGVTPEVINNRLKKYRESNPEWFGQLRSSTTGKVHPHIASELASKIIKEAESEIAPKNWKTKREMRKELGIGEYAMGTIIDKYRDKYSHWIKKLIPRGGGRGAGIKAEHYSPELVKLIKEDSEIKEKGKDEEYEDWMTLRSFVKSKKLSVTRAKKFVEYQRDKNPNWFKELRSPRGIIREYLSPDLLIYIEEELSKSKVAPENWATKSGLANELGVDIRIINRLVVKYKKSNLEFVKKLRHKDRGRVLEHLSPELQEKIKEELGK